MVAFTFRMPAGIPGEVTRANNAKVEPQLLTASGQTGAPTAYGVPVNIDATTAKVRTVVSPDAAVYGFLVRPYPLQGNGTDGLGVSTPPLTSVPCDVLVSGYVNVKLGGTAAAVRGGAVFVRVASASSGKPIGGVEAAADGGNTIQLPATSYFMGAADAGGNTEIAFNV